MEHPAFVPAFRQKYTMEGRDLTGAVPYQTYGCNNLRRFRAEGH